MKAKFGAIVVDGRGKIGGHVASKNRAGAYIRTKVTPVNPQSESQLTVRNRFTDLSQAWRGLTEDQRAAWNAAVADYAKTNVFGDIKNPTGAQLYQRLNNNLVNVGSAAIDVPPIPSAVFAFSSFSFAVSTGGGTMLLTFAPVIPATDKILVFGTPAVSPGKSYVKNLLRQIDVLTTADLTGADIAPTWEAKFGPIPAAGQKIILQLKAVNVATGQAGVPLEASAIVAA